MEGMKAYISRTWRVEEDFSMVLIDDFDININLHQAKVDSETITKLMVDGQLAGFKLSVSTEKLNTLLLITSNAFASTAPAAVASVDAALPINAPVDDFVLPDDKLDIQYVMRKY